MECPICGEISIAIKYEDNKKIYYKVNKKTKTLSLFSSEDFQCNKTAGFFCSCGEELDEAYPIENRKEESLLPKGFYCQKTYNKYALMCSIDHRIIPTEKDWERAREFWEGGGKRIAYRFASRDAIIRRSKYLANLIKDPQKAISRAKAFIMYGIPDIYVEPFIDKAIELNNKTYLIEKEGYPTVKRVCQSFTFK